MAGPVRQDFELPRGDTWALLLTGLTFSADYPSGLSTAGAVVRCTVKRYATQVDPANVDPLVDAATGCMQVDSDAIGGITIASATSCRIVFTPSLTELLPIAALVYDVTVDFDEDHSYQLRYGEIDCRADITLTRG